MAAELTDLLIVERAGTLYKTTAADVVALAGAGSILRGETLITIPNGAGSIYWKETVSTPGVAPGQFVFLAIAPHVDADENNESLLAITSLSGAAGTDTITIKVIFLYPTSGAIRINWSAL